MKAILNIKILLIAILVCNLQVGYLFAQNTSIPDPNFETFLISLGIDTDGIVNGQVANADIENITYLNISGWDDDHDGLRSIEDLTGIEGFVSLETLICDTHYLTTLDLSQNTALKSLHCFDNSLTSLNLAQNSNLEVLDCSHNQLSSLDISQNTELKMLYCGINPLMTLDVSQNTNLEVLECAFIQLSSLDLSQNIALERLDCAHNQLSSLDISQNTALKLLLCSDNALTVLDVSQNTALESLYCGYNLLNSLDLSNNPALQSIHAALNELDYLDIRNGNNTAITYFSTYNNPNLKCIFVDDSNYSYAHWPIDPHSNFVETQQQCDELSLEGQQYLQKTIFHPNPTQDILFIEVPVGITITVIQLMDSQGKLLTQFAENTHSIDLSSYPSGVYFLVLEGNNEGAFTKKVVKW